MNISLQNNLISEMQALESMAQAKPVQLEQTSKPDNSFADLMKHAINQVNDTQMHSASLTRAFELGENQVDISQVMIAIQKSRVSFQALTEVRNKLLTAYQDVMNMPV